MKTGSTFTGMGFESSAFRMQGKKEKLSSKTILGDGWFTQKS